MRQQACKDRERGVFINLFKIATQLLENVDEKNKKISELENENTRLKLMKDQAKEGAEKKLRQSKNEDTLDTSKRVRCRYDNSGRCRKNSDCKDVHARKTCQSYSKLGSCPMESTCEHRHPHGICYDWEKYGSCTHGDTCRHRHPLDLVRSAQSDHFLGRGSPSRQAGSGSGQHRSPRQGHQDQRGNRR